VVLAQDVKAGELHGEGRAVHGARRQGGATTADQRRANPRTAPGAWHVMPGLFLPDKQIKRTPAGPVR